MKTAKAIIDKALSFVGTKESPAGSNNVIFNTDYYGHAVSGAAYPWCCTFVWDIFRMCSASDLFYNGEQTAYCPAVESWGRGTGLAVNKTDAKHGDIVLFDWNHNGVADHIGFVVENVGAGNIVTVEGNTSVTSNDNGGNVMRRARTLNDVCCVIRPKYDIEHGDYITMDEAKEMIDKAVYDALGLWIAELNDIPHESVRREVRVLLDCGAIDGGTPYEINPDDIKLPYNIVRALVMAKRYTDYKSGGDQDD